MPPEPEALPSIDRVHSLAKIRRSSSSKLAPYSSRLFSALSRETSSGRFIPQMDGLRFMAIAMVVLFHLNSYLMAKTSFYEHRVNGSDWLCRSALVGFHGVELFFVISGFILALPFASHRLTGGPAVNLGSYYLRRLTRLEPPYFVTLLVLTSLGVWLRPGSFSGSTGHLAASLFYAHNVVYGAPSSLLGIAWSLEIEVQFYLLVPVFTLLFAVRNTALRRSMLVLSAVLMTAVQASFLDAPPRFSLSILGYLQFFLLGFLIADIFLVEWKAPARKPLCWDILALAGWPLLFVVWQSRTLTHWLFPALVFALYCAAFRGRWASWIMSRPWITAVGGMCYSIYLIHYAVISGVGRFTKTIGAGLPDPLYLMTQFILVGIAIVLICGLYFLVLEKPCMKRNWPQRVWQSAKNNISSRHPDEQPTFAD
jgi:peptidoglycan/LPS O-acetylase OafA/YrhL